MRLRGLRPFGDLLISAVFVSLKLTLQPWLSAALPIEASFTGGLLQIFDPRVNEHHENEGFTAKHKGEGRGGERDIGFTIILAHDYKVETIPPGIGVHIVGRVFREDIELGGVEPLTREGMQDPNLPRKFNGPEGSEFATTIDAYCALGFTTIKTQSGHV